MAFYSRGVIFWNLKVHIKAFTFYSCTQRICRFAWRPAPAKPIGWWHLNPLAHGGSLVCTAWPGWQPGLGSLAVVASWPHNPNLACAAWPWWHPGHDGSLATQCLPGLGCLAMVAAWPHNPSFPISNNNPIPKVFLQNRGGLVNELSSSNTWLSASASCTYLCVALTDQAEVFRDVTLATEDAWEWCCNNLLRNEADVEKSLEDVLEAKLDQCLIHLEALKDLIRERDFLKD